MGNPSRNQTPLATIVLQLQELKSRLPRILDAYPNHLLGYFEYRSTIEAMGTPQRLKEEVDSICQAIDNAIRTLQTRVDTRDTLTNVPGIARSLRLIADSVRARETYERFSAILNTDGLEKLKNCMNELEEISGKIGRPFPKQKQTPALEALAFAEASLERIKGSPIAMGTKLVSYEAGQMHGRRITIATDQSCYIEAVLLFFLSSYVREGDLFKGTLVVAAPEDPSQVLGYTVGERSFMGVMQEMKIPVVEVKKPSPSELQQRISESIGVLVVQEDALEEAIDSTPLYLQLEPNYVARLGYLEVNTFPTLSMAYGLDPTVRKLVQFMTDYAVRENALSSFRKIGDEKAVELIIRALRDKDSDVRSAAIWALGEMGDLRAVEPIIQCLKDKDKDVREEAVLVLGNMKDAKAVEPLIQALDDEETEVRSTAAETLGEIGDVRAVEPLIQAINDSDRVLRWKAAYSLGAIGDVRAVEPLIGVLKDKDEDLRKAAASALGRIGDMKATEPLIQALRDENEDVRDDAVRSLGKLEVTGVSELLIEVLKHDPSRNVRMAAAWSLGEMQDVNAVKALTQALMDDYVRGAAEYALEKIRGKKS